MMFWSDSNIKRIVLVVTLALLMSCGILNPSTSKKGEGINGKENTDSAESTESAGVITSSVVAFNSDAASETRSLNIAAKGYSGTINLPSSLSSGNIIIPTIQNDDSLKTTERANSIIKTAGSLNNTAQTLGSKKVLKYLVGGYGDDCDKSYQAKNAVWYSKFSNKMLNGISYSSSESKNAITIVSNPTSDLYKCAVVVYYAVYTEDAKSDALYCPVAIKDDAIVYKPWVINQQKKPSIGDIDSTIPATGAPEADLAQIPGIASVKLAKGVFNSNTPKTTCSLQYINSYVNQMIKNVKKPSASISRLATDLMKVSSDLSVPTAPKDPAESDILYMTGMYYMGANVATQSGPTTTGQCGIPSAAPSTSELPCATLEVLYSASTTQASITNTLIRDCKKSDGYAQDVPAPNYCFGISGKCDKKTAATSYVTTLNASGTGFSQATLSITLPYPPGRNRGQPADRYIILPGSAFKTCADGAAGDTVDLMSLNKCTYKDVDTVWRMYTSPKLPNSPNYNNYQYASYLNSIRSAWGKGGNDSLDKYFDYFSQPMRNPNATGGGSSSSQAYRYLCSIGGLPLPTYFNPSTYEATYDMADYQIPSPTLIQGASNKSPVDPYDTVVFNRCESDENCGFNFMITDQEPKVTGAPKDPSQDQSVKNLDKLEIAANTKACIGQSCGLFYPIQQPSDQVPTAVSLNDIVAKYSDTINKTSRDKQVLINQQYLVLMHSPCSETDGTCNLDLCGYEIMRFSINTPGFASASVLPNPLPQSP